jgi:hypothetical protein
MVKRIRVKGIPKPEPDVRLYVLALLELARQLQAKEGAKDQQRSGAGSPSAGEGEADG